MNAPRRWLESDETSAEVAGLLAAGRAPRSMTSDEQARTARTVARMTLLPASLAALVWGLIHLLRRWGWMLAGGGAIVATVAVAVQLRAPSGSPHPSTTAGHVGAVEADPIPAPPVVEIAPPAVSNQAPSGRAPTSATPSRTAPSAAGTKEQPTSDLAREAMLLERARAEIRRDPCHALVSIDAHEDSFPSSQLKMEREVLRVDALQRCGRVEDAERRGRALLARSPGSLYEQRIREILNRTGGP